MPRLYLVTEEGNETPRLVNANTPSQAIGFVAKRIYAAKAASPEEVADCYEKGIKREDALAVAGESGE
jgi:hypothetical protein